MIGLDISSMETSISIRFLVYCRSANEDPPSFVCSKKIRHLQRLSCYSASLMLFNLDFADYILQ